MFSSGRKRSHRRRAKHAQNVVDGELHFAPKEEVWTEENPVLRARVPPQEGDAKASKKSKKAATKREPPRRKKSIVQRLLQLRRRLREEAPVSEAAKPLAGRSSLPRGWLRRARGKGQAAKKAGMPHSRDLRVTAGDEAEVEQALEALRFLQPQTLDLRGDLTEDTAAALARGLRESGSLRGLSLHACGATSSSSSGSGGDLVLPLLHAAAGHDLLSLELVGTHAPAVDVADALAQHTGLERLSLQLNGVSTADLASLPVGATQVLDLGGNRLGPGLPKAWLEEVVRADSALVLRGNNLGEEACQMLSDWLSSGQRGSRSLDLSGNNFGHRGCIALAPALRAPSVLRELDLSYTSIGPSGALAVAEALTDSHIEALDLRCCDIGREGCESIADSLKVGAPRLERLTLGGASPLWLVDLGQGPVGDGQLVGEEGCAALVEALKENEALATLTVAEPGLRPAATGFLAALAGQPMPRRSNFLATELLVRGTAVAAPPLVMAMGDPLLPSDLGPAVPSTQLSAAARALGPDILVTAVQWLVEAGQAPPHTIADALALSASPGIRA